MVRLFDILRKDGSNFVQQEDLKSMMAGILLSHPGLEFLQETPEFQDRCCPLLFGPQEVQGACFRKRPSSRTGAGPPFLDLRMA